MRGAAPDASTTPHPPAHGPAQPAGPGAGGGCPMRSLSCWPCFWHSVPCAWRASACWPAAVETLGSATVLAVDKTGTPTENRMAIAQLLTWPPVQRPSADSKARPVRSGTRSVVDQRLQASGGDQHRGVRPGLVWWPCTSDRVCEVGSHRQAMAQPVLPRTESSGAVNDRRTRPQTSPGHPFGQLQRIQSILLHDRLLRHLRDEHAGLQFSGHDLQLRDHVPQLVRPAGSR